jgi:hypothetical protein
MYFVCAFSEACLVREGDGCFAVFVDDRRAVSVKAHFDAEFAKKETFLCGRAEADDLGFCGVQHLQWCLSRAPRDGAAVDEEDIADSGQAGVRNIGE